MPLTAFCKDANAKVFSLDLPADFKPKEHEYACLDCNTKMLFVDGKYKVKHFRHQHVPDNCAYKPETKLHIEAKAFFYKLYTSVLNLGVKVTVEYRGLEGLRPDVFIEYEGKKYAIEIQIKYSKDYVFDKTHAYNALGIAPIWVAPLPKERGNGKYGKTALYKELQSLSGRVYCFDGKMLWGVRFVYTPGYRVQSRIEERVIEPGYALLPSEWARDDGITSGRFRDAKWW